MRMTMRVTLGMAVVMIMCVIMGMVVFVRVIVIMAEDTASCIIPCLTMSIGLPML
ncbi:hypothetical protein D3C77_733390 [compost metagenome]